jgi:hypothetical protein
MRPNPPTAAGVGLEAGPQRSILVAASPLFRAAAFPGFCGHMERQTHYVFEGNNFVIKCLFFNALL